MDDRFLYDFQAAPRPVFARALYGRLSAQPRRFAIRRLAWAGWLAALALAAALAFSPSARALARDMILRFGGWIFSNSPTYAEQFERRINSGTPTTTPDPTPLEWQAPPLLSADQAEASAGFPVYQIGSLPGGFSLVARSASPPAADRPFAQITTTWQRGDDLLVLVQTRYEPGAAAQELPVGEASVTQVTVQGVDGVWIEGMRLATWVDGTNHVVPKYANLLVWEKDGFEFWLQSTPGLPLEEMLALAAPVGP